MGLFDRFKYKKPQPEASAKSPKPTAGAPVEADTSAVILMGKDIGWNAISTAVEIQFGPKALLSVDHSHPQAPAMYFELEGVKFFCSYLPMPHPPQVCDFSAIEDGLFSRDEKEAILGNRAFLVLAQQGGGTSLKEKARVCRLFTQLAAVLLDVESALGIYVTSSELLISRRVYLRYAEILEQNLQDPDYFPVPLWVSIRQGQKGEIPLTGTWGLRQFGLLELWFLAPSADRAEIHQRLYLMSTFEIAGKELYLDTDTIQFTPGRTSVFKELNGALFITEG